MYVLLIYYFSESMRLRKYARYPWAAMSHLTPTKLDVFFRPNSGMRELSDSIARNVRFFFSLFYCSSVEKEFLQIVNTHLAKLNM